MTCLVDEYPSQIFETGIFKKFSIDYFNSRKHISESCNDTIDDIVQSVGLLLQKNGLSEFVGVSRVHNHFHLQKGEIVKATIGPNDGAIPYLSSEESIIHLKVVTLVESDQNTIPYMWAYDKASKKLVALQFFDASKKEILENWQRLIDMKNNVKEFFKEFVQAIENSGMEDKIGIYMFHDQSLNLANGKPIMEVTNEKRREQWIYPEDKDKFEEIKQNEDVTTTMWDFSSNKNQWCGIHCRNHCGHHCRQHCRRH